MADSFFDVFAQIETPDGIWTALDPIKVTGDRLLKGVSPDMLSPEERTYDPTYFGATNCPELNDKYDPNDQEVVAIAYKGCTPVTLFDEDNNPVAILHSEIHIVHPSVPEPSTTLGLLFLGLGSIAGLKRKDKAKK